MVPKSGSVGFDSSLKVNLPWSRSAHVTMATTLISRLKTLRSNLKWPCSAKVPTQAGRTQILGILISLFYRNQIFTNVWGATKNNQLKVKRISKEFVTVIVTMKSQRNLKHCFSSPLHDLLAQNQWGFSWGFIGLMLQSDCRVTGSINQHPPHPRAIVQTAEC